MKQALSLGLVMALVAASALGQAYRWVDKNGRVHYTQTPPPPDAKPKGPGSFFEIVGGHGSSFFLSRFGCPTGDASDILENAVHSIDAERRFGRSNDGEYANAELDRLIEESASILEMERRRPVLQKALATVTEELALVPLYIDQDVYAVKKPFTWRPRNDNFLLAAEVGVR